MRRDRHLAVGYLGGFLHLVADVDLAELLEEAEHGQLQLLVPGLGQPRVRQVHQLQHPGEPIRDADTQYSLHSQQAPANQRCRYSVQPAHSQSETPTLSTACTHGRLQPIRDEDTQYTQLHPIRDADTQEGGMGSGNEHCRLTSNSGPACITKTK